MRPRFLYPVDTDQFEKIRQKGQVYVDKTDMIYDIVNVRKYEYVFLARPRRFGKSLLCNTLRAYFEGKKELFEGLKIASLETEWESYPVMHFIMSGLKNMSVSDAKGKLECFLRDYEKVYGSDSNENSPGTRFRGLIHRAYEQTGKPVVLLFDEYDSAIMRLLHEKDKLLQMREMLREFYQVVKDEGRYLKFVFFTGVTKFSHLSIFSEINNLQNISMDDEYSGICGITQEELDTVLRPCVEDFAERNEVSTEEAYAMLKAQYDGYHFSKRSQDVYAPFSLLRCLNIGELREFWFESGTSTSLLEYLKDYPIKDVANYDGIKVSASQFDIPCEDAATPLPLLYQSGYLSIDSYNKRFDSYILHYPNKEVRNGMINCLAPIILRQSSFDNDSLVLSMAEAIYDGNLSEALSCLRSYIAHIPYDIITKEEWDDKQGREAFYKLLCYMAFSMLNDKVDTEVKSILGRADVVIKTNTDIFVLELKVDDTVENALAQIDDKGYAIPYEADGRKITKCGISISSEARNITHWRSVSADGNIVDEQKF